ncbi:MAG TPA: protoporphyrinogen oxidase [Acidimicrobiales bacterium]|nr:protoporphyrinogen oxidase [Acidimicrobiales bacterium]
MRVGIVGGGIAGLAAAHEVLLQGGTPIVFESDERVGGKLRTESFDGIDIDTGPDSFLARRPEAVQLCRELGLDGGLEPPAATSAFVFARGALRRLPAGLILGVPTDPLALARSGILSPWGAARAAAEPFVPGAALGDDDALGAVIRRRYGDEVASRLVDPLLGGINAGDVDTLSIDTVAPQIAAAARADRSLTRALKRAPAPPPDGHRPAGQATSNDPVFLTVPGGLAQLVDALVASIVERGGEIRTGDAVSGISATSITSRSGTTDVQGVVLAAPAYVTAPLVEPLAPGAAGILSTIPYASVAMTLLAYDDARDLDASGFLVPKTEGLLMTAASWASSKWAHLARPGRILLRVSAGRHGDERAMGMDDDDLVAHMRADLATTMDMRGEPAAARVIRWPRSFPQYPPGHAARIAAAVAALPAGVALAGAALGGVGIPACIGSGRAAARTVLARSG